MTDKSHKLIERAVRDGDENALIELTEYIQSLQSESSSNRRSHRLEQLTADLEATTSRLSESRSAPGARERAAAIRALLEEPPEDESGEPEMIQ